MPTPSCGEPANVRGRIGGWMGGMRGADERSPRVTSAAGVLSQPERGPLSREGKAQPALEVPDEETPRRPLEPPDVTT